MSSGNPKHRAIIFRKDYPSLKHIISSSYALFLPMRASYNKSDHTWTFPSGATRPEAERIANERVKVVSASEDKGASYAEWTKVFAAEIDRLSKPLLNGASSKQSTHT